MLTGAWPAACSRLLSSASEAVLATTATANQPQNFQIWGTKTSGTQSISIAGNGVLSAIVYAPQGDTTIVGNGDVMGSIVADVIKVTGNAAFHYDESLANFGDNTPFGISRWRELTTADERARWSGVFSGW